jgi:hypothetical protein
VRREEDVDFLMTTHSPFGLFLLVSPLVICLLALLCMKGVCLAGRAAEGGVAAGAGGVARLQGAAAAQAQGHSAGQIY